MRPSFLSAGLLGLVTSARAACPVDQEADPWLWEVAEPVAAQSQAAQTFTVAFTGFLEQVDLLISGPGNADTLYVDILRTIGGVPDDGGTPLASAKIPDSQIPPGPPTFVPVYFGVFGANVQSGEVLAIVCRSSFVQFDWVGQLTDIYPGGGPFVRSFGTQPWTPLADEDLGFRARVCRAVPVPEPDGPVSWAGLKALYR